MAKVRSPRHIRRWVRHASATHEEAWRERLAVAGTGLVVHSRPGTKLLRLEVYGPDRMLRALTKEFGGKLERIDTVAIATRANAPRRPLRITADLAVIDVHGKWPEAKPRPRILLRIAGAMAFGTGEHATTAACLRFLYREAAQAGGDWTMLDIGTGSGILAIAAEKLGANGAPPPSADAALMPPPSLPGGAGAAAGGGEAGGEPPPEPPAPPIGLGPD